ncbi:TPA: hypothetical protein EYP70_05460 [Candidatus Bathyarchaeota archaeon]|nr:hypothetical protein [Candidatus Bathyarchaeota archaeon]
MGKIPISYIDISMFAHATEDEEKVLKAAKAIIPKEEDERVSFKKNRLKGEYGNPITFFKVRVKEPRSVEAIIAHLSSHLTESDKASMLRDFSLRLCNGILYIRLDKQKALQGRLKLCNADPIHVRIRFKAKKVRKIEEICRRIGILL